MRQGPVEPGQCVHHARRRARRAKYVIHAAVMGQDLGNVGVVHRARDAQRAGAGRCCTELTSIAFPAFGTGVAGSRWTNAPASDDRRGPRARAEVAAPGALRAFGRPAHDTFVRELERAGGTASKAVPYTRRDDRRANVGDGL